MNILSNAFLFFAGQPRKPAYIRRDATTGTVTHEAWYKGDKLDRRGGPAIIWRDAATRTVTYAAWYKDDKEFEPSPEVRAAWLQKEDTENAARARVSSAPAPRPRS